MAIALLASIHHVGAAEIGYVDGDGDIQKPFDVFWVERLIAQGHNVTPLPVNYDPTGPEAANLDIFIVSADIGSGDFIQGIGVVPEVEFTGSEGSVWYGGGDLDAGFAGGPPRILNLNPIDLTGQTNVELTIGLAARPTGWDEGQDFLTFRLDIDGDMDYETELADFRPINGDLEDTISGTILNTEFQDLTLPIGAGINTLRFQIDAFSTATGEQLGFDNIRVTGTGGATIGSENFEGGNDQIGYTTVGQGGTGAAFWDLVTGEGIPVSTRVTDPRPIITTEPALPDDFQMVDVAGAVSGAESFLDIDLPDHPMAAGLSGIDVEIFFRDQGMTHLLDDAGAGTLAPGLDVVASIAATGLPAIAILEAGAEGLDGNPSPGQRILFFPDDDGDGDLYTDDGLALLDAAVAYALANVPVGNSNDCNGDGVVDVNDANCACEAGDQDLFDAVLTELGSLKGDADGDGQVQFSDFVILSENFGQAGQYTDGDFDWDGQVQFSDFVILSENFGKSGGQQLAAVPEPSSVCLCIAAVMGILGLRPLRLPLHGFLGAHRHASTDRFHAR